MEIKAGRVLPPSEGGDMQFRDSSPLVKSYRILHYIRILLQQIMGSDRHECIKVRYINDDTKEGWVIIRKNKSGNAFNE